MDVYELLGEIDRCERRLAETRRRFVLSGGRAEFAYNDSRVGRSLHAELVKLEAELRHSADRLHEFRLAHQHAPVEPASHSHA
jgi:hypothetical protein